MGGKPKTNTPKDMRLKANNPSAGNTKSKVTPAAQPTTKPAPKKGGKA